MKYLVFVIILAVNIIILYPFVQYEISKPKIIVRNMCTNLNIAQQTVINHLQKSCQQLGSSPNYASWDDFDGSGSWDYECD